MGRSDARLLAPAGLPDETHDVSALVAARRNAADGVADPEEKFSATARRR
jgi:hypothetical protein